MILPGKVTIARSTHSRSPDTIHIEITDANSGISFVDATISLAEFAQAVTGHGRCECELEVRGLEYVGMLYEHKQEEITFRGRYGNCADFETDAAATLAPYEADGWRGRPSDLRNMHNRVAGKSDTYRVHFFRYVPAPAAEEPAR
jgi:hypothetical protein